MKKFILFISCLFLSVLVLSASVYKTPKKLSVIQTKYFDIIYPEESTYTANLIASKADNFYLQACELLSTSPTKHFPVVITPDTQILNAYFTLAYSSYICVYDTLPEKGDLTVFNESITGVFYHELVHAVSCNIRSPFVNGISKIFGDIVQPSMYLNLPLSFVEGVTVSFESKNDEGRLNDPYCMAYLTQAKLEGNFPKWKDISGAKDTFTNGSLPYLYGGSFNQFLQEKYGMQKYAEFWYLAGSYIMESEDIFYYVYSSSIEDIWKAFESSIPLPFPTQKDFAYSNANGTVENERFVDYKDYLIDLKDFPDRDILKYNGNFESLVSSDDAIAWIDYPQKKIRYLKKSYLLGKETDKTKEYFGLTQAFRYVEDLFECDGYAGRIQFSRDGKYLLFCSTNPNSEKNYASVFDIEKKKFIGEKFDNLRDACFFQGKDGTEYIAGVALQGQFATIKVYPFTKMKSKNPQVIVSIPFTKDQIPFNLVTTGPDTFSCIKVDSGNWSICKINPFTKEQVEIGNEDHDIVYKDLYSTKNQDSSYTLTFTWMQKSKKGMLSRIGKLKLGDEIAELEMQEKDVSGGIHCPILLDDDVYYIAQFFEYDKILKLPSKVVFEKIPSQSIVVQDLSQESPEVEESKEIIAFDKLIKILSTAKVETIDNTQNILPENPDLKVKRYNPFKYMTKGIFLPWSTISMKDDMTSLTEFSIPLELGFTYLTGDPTTTWINTLTGFYDPLYSNAAAAFQITNSSLPVSFTLDGTGYFNFSDTLKYDLAGSLVESYSVYLSNLNNVLQFSNKTLFDYHHSIAPRFIQNNYLDIGSVLYDEFSIGFSNKRKIGMGKLDYKGMTLLGAVGYLMQFSPSYILDSSTLVYLGSIDYVTPSIATGISFLPSVVSPLSCYFDLIVYNCEIQKSREASSIYHNRFTAKLGYDFQVLLPIDTVLNYSSPLEFLGYTEDLRYVNNLVMKFNYVATFTNGVLSSYPINMGLIIKYNLDGIEDPVSIGFSYELEM